MNLLRFYKKKCEDIKENPEIIALEISLPATARGFESHRLRQSSQSAMFCEDFSMLDSFFKLFYNILEHKF